MFPATPFWGLPSMALHMWDSTLYLPLLSLLDIIFPLPIPDTPLLSISYMPIFSPFPAVQREVLATVDNPPNRRYQLHRRRDQSPAHRWTLGISIIELSSWDDQLGMTIIVISSQHRGGGPHCPLRCLSGVHGHRGKLGSNILLPFSLMCLPLPLLLLLQTGKGSIQTPRNSFSPECTWIK